MFSPLFSYFLKLIRPVLVGLGTRIMTTTNETKTIDTPKFNAIMLPCIYISPKFFDFNVITTHKEVMKAIEMLSQYPLARQKRQYVKALMNVMKYSNEEMTSHFEKQSQEFQDWCDDVAIFYAVRYVLMNKPIPMLDDWAKMPPRMRADGIKAWLRNK